MIFEKPKPSDFITLKDPNPLSTFKAIIEIYIPRAEDQTKKATAFLQKNHGFKNEDFLWFMWQWCRANFNYQEDKAGIEQIRLPNQSWADRKKGIDCEDFVILIAGILDNLDLSYTVRMVDYGDGWQHIYIITKTGYVIDPVNAKFNHELPYKHKLDHHFTGWADYPLHTLSGIPTHFSPKTNTTMLTPSQKRLKRVSERADKLVQKAGTKEVVTVVNRLNRKDAMKKAWAIEKGQESVASRTIDGTKKRGKKKTAKRKTSKK